MISRLKLCALFATTKSKTPVAETGCTPQRIFNRQLFGNYEYVSDVKNVLLNILWKEFFLSGKIMFGENRY